MREEVLELAATEKTTVPTPFPLAPALTVIHEALLVTVQEQPLPALTPKLPDAAEALKVCWVGESE